MNIAQILFNKRFITRYSSKGIYERVFTKGGENAG